jgi:hypothetical protein
MSTDALYSEHYLKFQSVFASSPRPSSHAWPLPSLFKTLSQRLIHLLPVLTTVPMRKDGFRLRHPALTFPSGPPSLQLKRST